MSAEQTGIASLRPNSANWGCPGLTVRKTEPSMGVGSKLLAGKSEGFLLSHEKTQLAFLNSSRAGRKLKPQPWKWWVSHPLIREDYF